MKDKITDPTVKRTGVFATIDEWDSINNAGISFSPFSTHNPQIVCHEIALKHGLPEREGYYGIDPGNREFLTRAKESKRKTTNAPPVTAR